MIFTSLDANNWRKAPTNIGMEVIAAIRLIDAFNATAKGVINEAVMPSITAKATPSYTENLKLFLMGSSAMGFLI